MTFFNCRLRTTPIFQRRLFSVLSKFSHENLILVGCQPLEGVTRGGLPPRSPHPLVTPLEILRHHLQDLSRCVSYEFYEILYEILKLHKWQELEFLTVWLQTDRLDYDPQ